MLHYSIADHILFIFQAGVVLTHNSLEFRKLIDHPGFQIKLAEFSNSLDMLLLC